MLVTVIILFGDGEFHESAYLLWRNRYLLRVARGSIKADDLSVCGKADGGSFVGFHGIMVVSSRKHWQHGYLKLLWDFGVKVHIDIAMLMEKVVGDFFPVFFCP